MYLLNLMNKSGTNIVLFYRSLPRLKIGSSLNSYEEQNQRRYSFMLFLVGIILLKCNE